MTFGNQVFHRFPLEMQGWGGNASSSCSIFHVDLSKLTSVSSLEWNLPTFRCVNRNSWGMSASPLWNTLSACPRKNQNLGPHGRKKRKLWEDIHFMFQVPAWMSNFILAKFNTLLLIGFPSELVTGDMCSLFSDAVERTINSRVSSWFQLHI